MNGMNIKPIGPIEITGQTPVLKVKDTSAQKFQDTLQSAMEQLTDINQKADQTIEKMATGEIQDVHQVMIAVEKANITFSTMMQVRNKLLDAYKEVMNMRF